MKHIVLTSLISLLVCSLSAQKLQNKKDSIAPSKSTLSGFIVPVALVGTALILNNSTLEKQWQKSLGGNSSTSVDDYTRFAPLAQLYIADIVGVKSENHWFDQSKNIAISLLLTDFITSTLKKQIDKNRPNGLNNNAFPSAHSAYGFTTATVLYEEFKNTKPWLAYSGYGFALATASLRVVKDDHFVSDVLLGAGIGIAVVKLVYWLDQFIPWNPFLKKDNMVIAPTIQQGGFGLSGVLKF